MALSQLFLQSTPTTTAQHTHFSHIQFFTLVVTFPNTQPRIPLPTANPLLEQNYRASADCRLS
jgi:hypothetical protein